MEKRLNTKFDLYIKNFKDGIRDKMSQLQMASGDAADLMEGLVEPLSQSWGMEHSNQVWQSSPQPAASQLADMSPTCF